MLECMQTSGLGNEGGRSQGRGWHCQLLVTSVFCWELGRELMSITVCNKDNLIFIYCLGDLADITYDTKNDKIDYPGFFF